MDRLFYLACAFVGVASLAACSKSPTSPPGMLGEVDLKPKLPPGVTAPPDAELASHETTRTICGVSGYPPAEIKVRWKSFKKGEDSYITGYSVELTKPGDALTVALGRDGDQGSANLTPGAPYVGMVTFHVKCTRKTVRLEQQGGELIQLKADGTVPGAPRNE